MKTKKQYGWMLRLLSVVFLLAGLTACGSSEGSVDEKEPEKPKPEVPVADGDWQVVPATGGTITKDSISITFPSGTFSEETKVAITDTKKGETLGEYEVSKFYQITMPVSTARSLTVKMKCVGNGDDINAVIHAPVTAISEQMQYYNDVVVESTYSGGEYTMILPAFANGDETENVSFSIGIAKIPRLYCDDMGENYVTRSPQISWHFEGTTILSLLFLNNWKASNIGKHINDAIVRLQALGLEINRECDIPITFSNTVDKAGDPCDGVMNQHWLSNKYNSITLNINYIMRLNQNYGRKEWSEANLSRTVIHELMHYFQAEYDPRTPLVKSKVGGDWLQLYESGAAWSEKFNDGNTPSSEFIKQYLPSFIRGLKEIDEVYGGTTKHDEQGYGMASLIEYITKCRKSENFNNTSIHELYKLWSTGQPFFGGEGTSVDFIQMWVESSPHNSKLFYGSNYDDFVLALAKGEVCDNIYVSDYYFVTKSFNEMDVIQFDEGKCYPYGCQTDRINCKHANFQTKGYFNNKQMVIEQNNDGVQTYALYFYDKKCRQIDGVARKDQPLIIDGNLLESLRNKDDTYGNNFIYLISTNRSNQTTIPTNVTVKVVDKEDTKPAKVEPDKVEFDAMGGSNNEVKIIKGSYKNCGVDDVQAPDSKWLSAKGTSDGAVTIEAKPNMSFEGRKGEVKCWVSNKDNPQPGDKKYLTVEVIQNGVTGVDWDPKSLRFTASGGSEKISFKFGEFTRFGAQVRKEGQGWCGVAAANGKLTITVQPNETKEPRECIVDAYVTNSQNPTEEDKVIMPITVYQEGAKETKPSSLKIKSVVFSAEYNDGSKRSFMVDWNKKEGTIQAEIINGSTHVTCTNNTGYNKSTLSFDIDNESLLTSKKATFSNFKTEGKEYYMSKISNEWNIATKSKSDYDYYTDLTGGKTCSLHWKQGEFTTFEHSQTNNSITLSDSKLSELEATVSIFFEEPPQ